MKAIYLILFSVLMITVSCEQKYDYEQWVEQELEKGVRYDSLFLGYYLGMKKQEFFDHSWELNRKKVITGTVQIEYRLENLESSATMRFYPEFNNNRIYKMPVEVSYDAWAPWNKDLFSDHLIMDLLDFYENEYEGNFIRTIHPENGKESWLNISGNRRISIFKKDDTSVYVEFLDLRVKNSSS